MARPAACTSTAGEMYEPEIHMDFETGSACELKSAGVYRYAEHPTTHIKCLCYGYTPDMVWDWRPGYAPPLLLLDHIRQGRIIVAHNAAFERVIWNWLLRVRYHPEWPELRIEQQRCTMAQAAAVSMPQGLDQLGDVLGLKAKKDIAGHALMMKLAKPRKIHPNGAIDWWDNEPYNPPALPNFTAPAIGADDDIPF